MLHSFTFIIVSYHVTFIHVYNSLVGRPGERIVLLPNTSTSVEITGCTIYIFNVEVMVLAGGLVSLWDSINLIKVMSRCAEIDPQ